ncbi:MAG TPA: HepT-like ribonuclease domain-containing protein [Pantanalinema sp.]
MKDAAKDALGFVQGRRREDLDTDRLLAYGLVKAIEIAGEAANQVSKDTQARFPEIPWRGLIAMRHRTIHGYIDVDYDVVWVTVTERLPELVTLVEAAIGVLLEAERPVG